MVTFLFVAVLAILISISPLNGVTGRSVVTELNPRRQKFQIAPFGTRSRGRVGAELPTVITRNATTGGKKTPRDMKKEK
jgi:hypothetical protein